MFLKKQLSQKDSKVYIISLLQKWSCGFDSHHLQITTWKHKLLYERKSINNKCMSGLIDIHFSQIENKMFFNGYLLFR